jgi:small GTP-binding protein
LNFLSKELIDLPNSSETQKKIRLQIWDTAGQERFRGIASSYYRLCLGVIIVYDVTNRESFNNLDFWFDEVLSYADEHVEIVLLGNKSDLVARREVTIEEGIDYARKRNIPFYETSALDNKNGQIQQVFQELCQRVILNTDLHSKISSTRPSKDKSSLSLGIGRSEREIELGDTQTGTQNNKGFIRRKCC